MVETTLDQIDGLWKKIVSHYKEGFPINYRYTFLVQT